MISTIIYVRLCACPKTTSTNHMFPKTWFMNAMLQICTHPSLCLLPLFESKLRDLMSALACVFPKVSRYNRMCASEFRTRLRTPMCQIHVTTIRWLLVPFQTPAIGTHAGVFLCVSEIHFRHGHVPKIFCLSTLCPPVCVPKNLLQQPHVSRDPSLPLYIFRILSCLRKCLLALFKVDQRDFMSARSTASKKQQYAACRPLFSKGNSSPQCGGYATGFNHSCVVGLFQNLLQQPHVSNA
jgi:hypothetical protein